MCHLPSKVGLQLALEDGRLWMAYLNGGDCAVKDTIDLSCLKREEAKKGGTEEKGGQAVGEGLQTVLKLDLHYFCKQESFSRTCPV